MITKVHFAADHAGFEMKNSLLSYVREELGLPVEDHGSFAYDEHDDYPEFMAVAAESVAADPSARAIILGGSGQGEAMAANKIKGARAAVYYGGDTKIVTLSRQHNNANILSLGARFLSLDEAKEAVKLWLSTDFSGDERHARRVKQLDGGKKSLAEEWLGAIMKNK